MGKRKWNADVEEKWEQLSDQAAARAALGLSAELGGALAWIGAPKPAMSEAISELMAAIERMVEPKRWEAVRGRGSRGRQRKGCDGERVSCMVR